jgi:hypothetical protein
MTPNAGAIGAEGKDMSIEAGHNRIKPLFEQVCLLCISSVLAERDAALQLTDGDAAQVNSVTHALKITKHPDYTRMCKLLFTNFADNVGVNQVHP